jgi:RNA polymerase sigma-70 factor (ECF subfamily)
MTDSEIIAAFALDENQGVRALIQTHAPKLFALICPIVGSQEATDEVLQRVFIFAWKGISKFRQESSLSTWLHRIALRTAWKYIQQEGRITRDEKMELSQGSQELDSTRNPQLLLLQSLAELPPKQRLVFVLRYFESMPFNQIASFIQCSEGNAKAQYHHARKKIEHFFSLHD